MDDLIFADFFTEGMVNLCLYAAEPAPRSSLGEPGGDDECLQPIVCRFLGEGKTHSSLNLLFSDVKVV